MPDLGGLVQLIAVGSQDAYLTGDPQVSYFQAAYKRHTNFVIEHAEQTLRGTPGFGSTQSATISRAGDLLHRAWFEFEVPRVRTSDPNVFYDWARDLGYACIEHVELEIGGRVVERLTGEWMHIRKELTTEESQLGSRDRVLGNWTQAPGEHDGPWTVCVPLPFFFTREHGLALPLIALQHHEVEVHVQWKSLREILARFEGHGAFADRGLAPGDTLVDPFEPRLLVDYVLLDNDERMRFATREHEYLIEQVQTRPAVPWIKSPQKIALGLNHPVKALYWVFTDESKTKDRADPFQFESALVRGKFHMQGVDRTPTMGGEFFEHVQPSHHHTRTPGRGIYMYGFGLRAERYHPSGACNMSRIDGVDLVLEETAAPPTRGYVHVYAVHYNVLRISSGMGSLTYAN